MVSRKSNVNYTETYQLTVDTLTRGASKVQKSVYLSLRKVKVQKVTLVEFGMYNRSHSGDVL